MTVSVNSSIESARALLLALFAGSCRKKRLSFSAVLYLVSIPTHIQHSLQSVSVTVQSLRCSAQNSGPTGGFFYKVAVCAQGGRNVNASLGGLARGRALGEWQTHHCVLEGVGVQKHRKGPKPGFLRAILELAPTAFG